MVHSLFAPEVRLMLHENDVAGMKAFLENLHPATVADSLTGDLEVEQVWKFLENTNIRNQAAIFEYFPIEFTEANRFTFAFFDFVNFANRVEIAHACLEPIR